MGFKELVKSKERNCLTKEYIVPKRIVSSVNAKNCGFLLTDASRQPLHSSEEQETCVISKGGYVLLDMGSEINGGIEITLVGLEGGKQTSQGNSDATLRIVFGESVSEALSAIGDGNGAVNDHSTRDMTVHTTTLSRMRYGNTGFRFVKIAALDATVKITCIKGVFEYRDIEYKGSFCCNDERLNKIYDTAAYTVHLCMQEMVWDGIKRDRLVWIGDFHPEMSTISAIFGYDESVEKTLDYARDVYPIKDLKKGYWMVFPSYSCWWIVSHRDWYMQNGKIDYLNEQKEYMYALANQIIESINPDGTLDFCNAHYFVDWSSNETPYMEAGFRGCVKLGLSAAAEIFDIYGDDAMAYRCREVAGFLGNIKCEYESNKQVSAIVTLSELYEDTEILAKLKKDLPHGMSTFYGYYVLRALAELGDIKTAIEVMRSYWGAMLDVGATTFWEDFDIDWTENSSGIDELPQEGKKDIHTTYGRFCYEKLRLSLCHGWSSGPAPFIAEYILGIKILEPGCKKLLIKPNLGDLEWVRGTYPTPYGIVEIEHRYKNGKLISKINAPDNVEVVVG